MPTDIKHIKKQFEKSMNSYDENASVQNLTAELLITALSGIKTDYGTILELGAGTGLLTKRIAESFGFENYWANDLVEKSEMYVKKYIPDAKFLCGNALKIKPGKKMDLIISNAMFQWFENFERAIDILKSHLAKDGILAFSTFTPDNFCEITELTGLGLKYKSSEEIETILKNSGLDIVYTSAFKEVLTFNSPLEILNHMKKTGVNCLSEKTWTIKNVKDFCERYNEKYSQAKLTYSPVIFVVKNRTVC